MTYTLNRSTTSRRGGLLGMVLGAHILVALVLMTVKAVAPHIAEMPMVVELIQEATEQPTAKPEPVSKPQPVHLKMPPKPVKPTLETTTSMVQANAPIAPAVVSKPAQIEAPAAESVSQARFDADYLKNPAPPYPPLARRAGEEGKVVLRVSVSPQGTAESVDIKTSSGSSRLDESASKTVRTWRFVPAKRGDTPVQSWVLIPIIFKLEQ